MILAVLALIANAAAAAVYFVQGDWIVGAIWSVAALFWCATVALKATA